VIEVKKKCRNPSQEEYDAFNKPFGGLLAVAKQLSSENKPME
jgi:hypothetical protein